MHSTATALLKGLNDFLTNTDAGALNILILLDLSTAFDTVSHESLLTRLLNLGVEHTALNCSTTICLGWYYSGCPSWLYVGPLTFHHLFTMS